MAYTNRVSQTPMTVSRAPSIMPVVLFMSGILSLPLMAIQISVAQPAHLWLLAALLYMVLLRSMVISKTEAIGLCFFLGMALILTFMQGYPKVKAPEQVLKFAFFYPAFYFVGRWLGQRFVNRPLPVGYLFLFGFLVFQYLTQALQIPVIYKEHIFGQGALNGTFRERNWLAVYFLLLSYALLLKDESRWRFIPFFAINVAVMILSGSKTTFVASGIIFLLHAKTNLGWKVIPMIAGAVLYMAVFADEFSEEKLNVKLQEERGLAYQETMDLIEANPLGYGFGFVEAYFGQVSTTTILGLGSGVNSVFSVPLDLYLIGGIGGLVFWGVFFLGIGNGALAVLLPIGALSILNPLHQSEIVYFFCGLLVSLGRKRRRA